MKDTFRKYLYESSIEFAEDVSLKEKTWIKRGGFASFYVLPKSVNDLICVCRFLLHNNIHFDIVGHTSNIYFTNEYNTEVLISTKKLSCIEESEDVFICDTGVSASGFSRRVTKKGYKGYEGLVGMPGTIGGAVVNNSSAFGYSILENATEVECLNERGEIEYTNPQMLILGHRSTIIKEKNRRLIVLRVKLKKEKGNPKELQKRLSVYEKKRSQLMTEKRMNLGSCYKKCDSTFRLKVLLTIRFLLRHFFSIFPKSFAEKQYERKVFFSLAGYPVLVKYMDKKQPNCFLWKDEGADEVFFSLYQPFMKKFYKATDLEIEIK